MSGSDQQFVESEVLNASSPTPQEYRIIVGIPGVAVPMDEAQEGGRRFERLLSRMSCFDDFQVETSTVRGSSGHLLVIEVSSPNPIDGITKNALRSVAHNRIWFNRSDTAQKAPIALAA